MTTVSNAVSITMYTALLPASEIAAGGNYNLHFLSPNARRHLTYSTEVSKGLSTKTEIVQSSKVLADVPLSIYLPRAGFL